MKRFSSRSLLFAALATVLAQSSGCGTPSRGNIEVRKQNQDLESQLKLAREEESADLEVIRGLRDRQGTLPTLPSDRLAKLFTTHGIQFGRLTGGADLDPNKPGDEGMVLHVFPVDDTGEKLKAAGSFDVDAFDLADPKSPELGHWHFDLAQSRQLWNGFLIEYNYVLTCPWQKQPRHEQVTVRVRFLDELTQTPFTAQTVIKVVLPASSATTQPTATKPGP